MRLIGKDELLEPLQKNALQIAKDSRHEFKNLDLLVCGDFANTNISSAYRILVNLFIPERINIPSRIYRWNIKKIPTREFIEELWLSIDKDDNWTPFYDWLKTIIF